MSVLADLLSGFTAQPPAAGRAGDAGLYGPGSLAWRVGRERALLLGGPAALLLQVAHPLVAAGVAEHSGFDTDPLRRLRATLNATLAVTFGDTDQARSAARTVARRHASVVGELREPAGRTPAGTRYDARDPELDTWVHVTLVWSALASYTRFVGPLRRAEQDAYVAQMREFGRCFGATDELMPGSLAELDSALRRAIDGGTLVVGETAQRLCAGIFAAASASQGPAAAPVAELLAAALLPAELRSAYGLRWGWAQARAGDALSLTARGVVAALPARARFWPHYLAARERVRTPAPVSESRPAPPAPHRRGPG